jgi:hypothetical protein
MPEKKLCFVIGPIGDDSTETRIHADWLLEGIIEPVMAEFPDFIVKRADHDPRPGLIDAQMINDLLSAELVIADLSFANPNAFYEIGVRHMAQKPIIHMQLSTEKPPFDLSLYRAIKFSRLKYRNLDAARTELRRSVDAVLSKDYQVENPVTHARGRLQLDQHATSEQKVIIDQLDAFGERIEMIEDQLRFLSPPDIGTNSNPFRMFTRPSRLSTTMVTFTKKQNFTDQLAAKIIEVVTQSYGPVVQIARGSTNLVLLIPSNVNIADLARLFEAADGLEVSATQQPPR